MRTLTALALLAVASTAAQADDWASPTTKYVKSESARYRAVVVPGGDKKPATLTLYDDKDPVRPVKLYQRKLVNGLAPVQILVADGGQVVTIDDWARAGYQHSLVIYDKKGKLVVDCALEQMLLPEELPGVEQSTSSRWWRAKEHPIWLEGAAVNIKSAWGAVLRFDLATGGQSRDGQRVVINGSDRCRARKR